MFANKAYVPERKPGTRGSKDPIYLRNRQIQQQLHDDIANFIVEIDDPKNLTAFRQWSTGIPIHDVNWLPEVLADFHQMTYTAKSTHTRRYLESLMSQAIGQQDVSLALSDFASRRTVKVNWRGMFHKLVGTFPTIKKANEFMAENDHTMIVFTSALQDLTMVATTDSYHVLDEDRELHLSHI